MTIAKLVVVHADISEGLLWELQAVRDYVPPSRLLISFLSWGDQNQDTRERLYGTFRKRANTVLSGLPEIIGVTTFMVFDSDWKPVPVGLNKWKRFLWGGGNVGAIRETLRPHLRQRGTRLGIRNNIIFLMNILLVANLVWNSIIAVRHSSSLGQAFVILFGAPLLYFCFIMVPINLIIRALLQVLFRAWLRLRAEPAEVRGS